MKTPDKLGKAQVQTRKLANSVESLHRNAAISEICPPNQDVDHDCMTLLAQLLAVTKNLDHLILIVS